MRVALVSDTAWREAIPLKRARGAELICLPQLSFAPYVAATRDRGGLEQAERPPSRRLREACEIADGAWVSASAYESEGEGVFYVTSYLIGPDGEWSSYRQRDAQAAEGRWEQMFWTPGHEHNTSCRTPIGRAATLVGGDLTSAVEWESIAALGVEVVTGGASEDAERWQRTRRVVAGMAAQHGITVLVVNRHDESPGVEHPGGTAAFDSSGTEIEPDADGLLTVEPR